MRLTAGIKGSNNLQKWIDDSLSNKDSSFLESIGQQGVNSLKTNTPRDTGGLANGWGYKVSINGSISTIRWFNDAYPNLSINLATAIQYGHGTKNGGWVPGRDYINPALRPVFNKVSNYYLKKGD